VAYLLLAALIALLAVHDALTTRRARHARQQDHQNRRRIQSQVQKALEAMVDQQREFTALVHARLAEAQQNPPRPDA
jgi:hypothetical protein